MSRTSHASVADKPLFRLTWPIFIELALVFMIGIVDIWFLSQVSTTAAAGVGAILGVTALAIMFSPAWLKQVPAWPHSGSARAISQCSARPTRPWLSWHS
ncbi:hypothetical protein [Alkalilimnicola ehrlichii]|uniref:hypothetical protein n=1 Tax=Alkalilimnicola ehrlichii TaxID=351052 RepID=UPI0015F278C5|nr:hypothetical protein [Alkalilimnicola ehrlichii]